MSQADWVTVVPGPEGRREAARALLGLAERPEDVMTLRGGSEFLVAPYVAERYNAPAPTPDPPKPRARRTKKED